MKRTFFPIILILSLYFVSEAQDLFRVRQLTFDPFLEDLASWSSDGKKLTFAGTGSWNFDIWIMDVDTVLMKIKPTTVNKK